MKFCFGEMSERSMVQSWKGCVLKGTGGSNPPLSAVRFKKFFMYALIKALRMSSGPMQEMFSNPVRSGRKQR